MDNLLAIVIVDAHINDKAVDAIRAKVREQMQDGVLVKHKMISKIILIDKKNGRAIAVV